MPPTLMTPTRDANLTGLVDDMHPPPLSAQLHSGSPTRDKSTGNDDGVKYSDCNLPGDLLPDRGHPLLCEVALQCKSPTCERSSDFTLRGDQAGARTPPDKHEGRPAAEGPGPLGGAALLGPRDTGQAHGPASDAGSGEVESGAGPDDTGLAAGLGGPDWTRPMSGRGAPVLLTSGPRPEARGACAARSPLTSRWREAGTHAPGGCPPGEGRGPDETGLAAGRAGPDGARGPDETGLAPGQAAPDGTRPKRGRGALVLLASGPRPGARGASAARSLAPPRRRGDGSPPTGGHPAPGQGPGKGGLPRQQQTTLQRRRQQLMRSTV